MGQHEIIGNVHLKFELALYGKNYTLFMDSSAKLTKFHLQKCDKSELTLGEQTVKIIFA